MGKINQRAEQTLRDYIKDEKVLKTYALVFDENTVMALHGLAQKGLFDILEYPISSGKEAVVFAAIDHSGHQRAVKIYKVTTSNFTHMSDYIKGDLRFKGVRKDKRAIVEAWTKKEFKNLKLAEKAGVRVPMAFGFQDNVLVMEFIGSNEGVAAPKLKEIELEDYKKAYDIVVESIARMIYNASLVYADFSEYNVLVHSDRFVFIDVGQAVLNSHPKAEQFFERDVRNIARYFNGRGVKADYEAVYADIKAWKAKLKA